MTTVQALTGFSVKSRVLAIAILLLLLVFGLIASALFWFSIWPLSKVEIFVAYSQVVIAAIAMYAVVTRLDTD